MLGGLSGPGKAQHYVAPHCPIGFTLHLGLSKSQRDQDPLSFFPPLWLALTQTHAYAFPLFQALLPHTQKLQIQPVRRRNTSCCCVGTAVVFVSRWHVSACFPPLSKTAGTAAAEEISTGLKIFFIVRNATKCNILS